MLNLGRICRKTGVAGIIPIAEIMILKNVLDRITGNIDTIELPNDTLITLSQIVSGCLFIQFEERPLMILKEDESRIEDLSGLKSLSINSELIERPEFPTIAAYIKVTSKSGETYNYEYFFNIESSEEMELYENITKQKKIEIVLYDELNMIIKQSKLDEKERALMTSMLEKASRLFDKA